MQKNLIFYAEKKKKKTKPGVPRVSLPLQHGHFIGAAVVHLGQATAFGRGSEFKPRFVWGNRRCHQSTFDSGRATDNSGESLASNARVECWALARRLPPPFWRT